MKINYFSILLLFSTFTLFSQNNDQDFKEIKNIAIQALKASEIPDYDAIINYSYPRMFELLSRQDMKSVLKSVYEGNDVFTLKLDASNPNFSFTEIYTNDSISYTFVGHKIKMQMRFKKDAIDAKEKDEMLAIFQHEGLIADFINDTTLEIIDKASVMIFIKDSYTQQIWKTNNYDAENIIIAEIYPDYILEEAQAFQEKLRYQNARYKDRKIQTNDH